MKKNKTKPKPLRGPKGKRRKSNNNCGKKKYEIIEFTAKTNEEGKITVTYDELKKLKINGLQNGYIGLYKAYTRGSGKEKVVSKSLACKDDAFLFQKDYLLNNFDSIAGIDTNNYELSGRRLSITASFFCANFRLAKTEPVKANSMPFFIIENVRDGLNPEVVGWHLFISHIFPMLNLSDKKRLALVVDSELGKLEAINSRSIPYYKDHFLPENISLIYSSADTGNDPPNALIRECDKSSKRLFKEIETGELKISATFGGRTTDYSGYTYVNTDTHKITG